MHVALRRLNAFILFFTFSLTIVPLVVEEAAAQPTNDDLADAVDITSLPYSDSATNIDATIEDDEAGVGHASVWWSFTPSDDGTLVVDTYGSNINTTLSIWTGAGHPLEEQAYNRNAGNTVQSELGAVVAAGTTYYVRVAGTTSSQQGDITLNVSVEPPLPNDRLADAIEITSLPFTGSGFNYGAGPEDDEAAFSCAAVGDEENSVWWKYTSTEDGILTVDTYGSSFNTTLSIWTGDTHPLTEEVCAGQGSSLDETTVHAAVATGEEYYIRVAGISSGNLSVEGSITLNAEMAAPIENDDLADAIDIPSLPFEDTGSNVGAAMENDEVMPSCQDEADNSVWWQYTASENGVLVVDTEGSAIYTTLSAWTGSDHPLTELACDESGTTSDVSLPVVTGETYFIRIAGTFRSMNQGDVRLNASLLPSLNNDDLADAVEITSFPFSDETTNVGATGEPDEVSSECSSSSGALNSVWWVYDAQQNGVLNVDTDGSDFDLVLSLWTGTEHPLEEVACSDDSPEHLSRNVSAGESYFIRVSGYSESGEGDISLGVSLASPLPNDDFADATVIPSLPFTDSGSNVGATIEADEVLPSCGTESPQEGSVWWTYTADEEGALTIDTGDSDFDLVLSLWTGSEHPLESLGCTDSDAGGVVDVMSGDTYHIRISGYDGDDVGEIGLHVSLAPPDPVYVDDTATGTEDGSSWADAYTSLLDALEDEESEIWIAEGTYSNDETPFELESGDKIYGGFAGTETQRSARDPLLYETILTGSADHVIYARSLGSSTVLDGVTVLGGSAEGEGNGENGGGFYCDGRGIYGTFSGGCSIAIRNVTFRDNHADNQGGALFLDGREGGSASAYLSNVVFENNSAGYGGAMYVNAEDGLSSPTILNAAFVNNSAGRGGAVEVWAGLQGIARPEFTNVVFAGNEAQSAGGVIDNSNAGGFGGISDVIFRNATFYGNRAEEGAVIRTYGNTGGGFDGSAKVMIYNSIDWNNTDDLEEQDNSYRIDVEGEIEIFSSLVENDCPLAVNCEAIVTAEPGFVDATSIAGPDGVFATDDDGLHLADGSPAIDAGDPAYNSEANDVMGSPRVAGGTIDLGAYEFGSTSPDNTPPTLPDDPIVSPDGTVLIGGDDEDPADPASVLQIEWAKGEDEDGDTLRYGWRLAPTEEFDDILLEAEVDTATIAEVELGSLASVLDSNDVSPGGSMTAYLQVSATDGHHTTFSEPVGLTFIRGTFVSTADEDVPSELALHGIFPNPFHEETTIRYELPRPVHVVLRVYDVLGRQVGTLVNERQEPGRKDVRFSGGNLPAGLYFLRLQAGDATQTQQMVHLE